MTSPTDADADADADSDLSVDAKRGDGPEPLAKPPQPTGKPKLYDPPIELRWQWGAAVALVAVAADIGLTHLPWNNVAGAFLLLSVGVGLLLSGLLQSTTSRALALAGMLFAPFLAIRTEPRLLIADVVAATGLYFAATVLSKGRSLWNLRPLHLLSDTGRMIEYAITTPFDAVGDTINRYQFHKKQGGSGGVAAQVMRGLLVTVPVVLVLGALLASADVVFRSFFDSVGNPGTAFGHLLLAGLGAIAMMVLLRMAAAGGANEPAPFTRQVGAVEAGIMLGAVNLLFAAFAIAQLLTVLGGADQALTDAGLTTKDFARQGFFQLLWVAMITLLVLTVVNLLTRQSPASLRIARPLGLITVVLTLAIVGVAFTRILFYINDDGHTPMRFYSAVFCLWIGACFLFVAARTAGFRPSTAWLTPVVAFSGLATLGVLNLLSPEAFIANQNIDAGFDETIWHVRAEQFFGEGVAITANRAVELGEVDGFELSESVCTHYGRTYHRPDESSWLDFNLNRERAYDAIAEHCPPG